MGLVIDEPNPSQNLTQKKKLRHWRKDEVFCVGFPREREREIFFYLLRVFKIYLFIFKLSSSISVYTLVLAAPSKK